MELHQVRYFLAICAEQSFTGAAKRCSVAQPSLTRAIKLLEGELGGLLFHRGQKMTRLSQLGHAVRPELEQIERLVLEVKRQAKMLLKSAKPNGTEMFAPFQKAMYGNSSKLKSVRSRRRRVQQMRLQQSGRIP